MPGSFSINVAPAAQAVPDFGLGKNINCTGSSNHHNLTAFCCGKPILFAADDGTNGVELWETDGTEAGTFKRKDINPSGDSSPAGMAGAGSGPHHLRERWERSLDKRWRSASGSWDVPVGSHAHSAGSGGTDVFEAAPGQASEGLRPKT